MKLQSAVNIYDSQYEPFFVARMPFVFDCMIEGSYGWCRFTDHDYGDFRENPEVVLLLSWLKEQTGGFYMEQAGQGDIVTPFTLYIENANTALLCKLIWG